MGSFLFAAVVAVKSRLTYGDPVGFETREVQRWFSHCLPLRHDLGIPWWSPRPTLLSFPGSSDEFGLSKALFTRDKKEPEKRRSPQ